MLKLQGEEPIRGADMIHELSCITGVHYGKVFRGSAPLTGLTILKRCWCGRHWYDTGGPFGNPKWMPISIEELVQHYSNLNRYFPSGVIIEPGAVTFIEAGEDI